MPALPVPRRPIVRTRRRTHGTGVSIVVLGDLALDVVIDPERALVPGTDVPGRVSLRQGGSAATTARVAADLGAAATLVTAVGRDAVGRALVADLRSAGVVVRAVRATGVRTGRIGVVLDGRDRSFVADRAAADALPPETLRPDWFRGADALHLPAYSLLADPLGAAARRAVDLARAAGAVVSVDLASTGPLLASGRRAAQRTIAAVAPDVLFATQAEATAVTGGRAVDVLDRLLRFAPVVAVKRGRAGATVLARREDDHAPVVRFDVATRPLPGGDPTGAGDAFDAGFLVAWLAAPVAERRSVASLRRAAVAGNQAAARYLGAPKRELTFA
jgi:sugar/nucleoside kinase (ribokinase family)